MIKRAVSFAFVLKNMTGAKDISFMRLLHRLCPYK